MCVNTHTNTDTLGIDKNNKHMLILMTDETQTMMRAPDDRCRRASACLPVYNRADTFHKLNCSVDTWD